MSATLALALSGPVLAKPELELLRERCAEQERRILQLEEENARLRGVPTAAKTTPAPTDKPLPSTTAAAPAQKQNPSYTVRKGDTLERIARKTGVSVKTLSQLNRLTASTLIHPGQTLKLPAVAKKESPTPSPAPATVSEPKPKEAAAPASKTISNPAPGAVPAAKSEPAPEKKPAATQTASGSERSVIRSIIIQNETTYGDFAGTHGTTIERLNELNGLSLGRSTVLAKGSELYVPAQP
jgi:LysM repeat protein